MKIFNGIDVPVMAVRKKIPNDYHCSAKSGVVIAVEDVEEITESTEVHFVPDGKRESCILPIKAFEHGLLEAIERAEFVPFASASSCLARHNLITMLSNA